MLDVLFAKPRWLLTKLKELLKYTRPNLLNIRGVVPNSKASQLKECRDLLKSMGWQLQLMEFKARPLFRDRAKNWVKCWVVTRWIKVWGTELTNLKVLTIIKTPQIRSIEVFLSTKENLKQSIRTVLSILGEVQWLLGTKLDRQGSEWDPWIQALILKKWLNFHNTIKRLRRSSPEKRHRNESISKSENNQLNLIFVLYSLW